MCELLVSCCYVVEHGYNVTGFQDSILWLLFEMRICTL